LGGVFGELAILVTQGMADKGKRADEVTTPKGRWRKLTWWLGTSGLLLLWAYLAIDPESWPDLSLLQYLPWPALLLPAALLALSMWPLGGRWRWAAWLPMLLVLGPIMGLCVGHPDEGGVRVRFMTYNVKSSLAPGKPGGIQRLALEIWQADPDIVVMQDAGFVPAWQTQASEDFKLMMGDRHMEVFGQYVIASRYRLSGCQPGFIPYEDHQHSFFHCQVDVRGHQLTLVTVHFNTPRDGLNATRHEGRKGLSVWKANMGERLYQSSYLAEFVRRVKGPCIVAGDLNAPERSRVVQNLLTRGMRDAYSASTRGWGYTHGHSLSRLWSFLRIDHILVSEDIGVLRAWTGGKEASEHRPVLAELVLAKD
jgi:endonuclease/exonuclease/phosphatase family metal-dependent hydrolase